MEDGAAVAPGPDSGLLRQLERREWCGRSRRGGRDVLCGWNRRYRFIDGRSRLGDMMRSPIATDMGRGNRDLMVWDIR